MEGSIELTKGTLTEAREKHLVWIIALKEHSHVTAHVPNFDFPTGYRSLKRCASSVTEPSKILVVVNFLSQVISLSLSFVFFRYGNVY